MELTERQKTCFDILYRFVHDEDLQCENLIKLIQIEFPRSKENINKIMNGVLIPYLAMRKETGKNVMGLLYKLK